MSKIEVNTIDVQCGSTLTLGSSGKTVTLAACASQSGFGRTGTVDWCTTAKTSPFTAVNGKGYFLNTTSGGITVTLPSSPSAGDIISFNDLNGTFDSNAVVLCRNSSKIKGACANLELKDERMSATVIYSGASQGWVTIDNANVCGATLKPQTYNVRYLVIAGGGGGGGSNHGSGAGAGGYRTLSCASFSVTKGTGYTVTIGAGGTGNHPGTGSAGSSSVFSTITSAGGALGKVNGAGNAGGSGSGGGSEAGGPPYAGGAGNTPPVSPSQGNNGGNGNSNTGTGGGGGAGAVGSNSSGTTAGAGGAGETTNILGSIPQAPSYGTPGPAPGRYFAGGGGGATEGGSNAAGGTGGGGQGGPGPSSSGAGVAGTANTGSGGGGGGRGPGSSGDHAGGAGGSGIVILKHATSAGGSGGNVTATCGSDTVRIFTGSGTFTA